VFMFSKCNSVLQSQSVLTQLNIHPNRLVACFLGRPNSLATTKIEIPMPTDPFLTCLVRLSQIMCRAVSDIYEKPHESFLSMEKIATAIHCDLRHFEGLMQRYMGFGVHPGVPGHGRAVCQIILTSCRSPSPTCLLCYQQPHLADNGLTQSKSVQSYASLDLSTISHPPRKVPAAAGGIMA
jgi:hypothetical protein